MYDFYFGDKKKILEDQESFLIFVKRLLPRWANGIPDSECIAIYRTLKLMPSNEKHVLVETGCGASTIAMCLFSAIHGGKVFSWDTNGSKGHFLKSVISEAVCAPLGSDMNNFWKFIAFDSTNQHIGIPVLTELGFKASFGYFDSWHTLDHLMKEIQCFEQVKDKNFFVALDDAYYTKKHENYSYINMHRIKLGLNPLQEPRENLCAPFYKEIDKYLKKKYLKVEKLLDTYKKDFSSDLFFKYYEGDRNTMNKLGMEEKNKLGHRFDVWSVSIN